MLKVDLNKIIEEAALDEHEVAKELFPANKYPKVALDRVLKGTGKLDSDQMSKLASLLNCTVSQLYTGGGWKAKTKKGLHIFTNDGYRAELDLKTWKTTIYHNESLFFEDVIHPEQITLSAYLRDLDSIIKGKK